MKTCHKNIVYGLAFLLTLLLVFGCEDSARKQGKGKLVTETNLGTTIGSLVEVFTPETIRVQSYGLVGGLKGTGSVECPPEIRNYLIGYIRKQLPHFKNIEKLISSKNTAVVRLRALMPTAVTKNKNFDVQVSALPGTQTTSLGGGQLWGAELFERGRFAIGAKAPAKVEGPIYIDKIDESKIDLKSGFILGGGNVADVYSITLALRQPDFIIASRIRNRLIEHFGTDVAKAISDSQVDIAVPPKYAKQKQRFIAIVKATFLAETEEIVKQRINTSVRELAVSKNKYAHEIALEAIGNRCLDKLKILLNSSNEEVRFRTARCMLNLGNDKGLDALRKIALDKISGYRIEALETITRSGTRNDAAAISRRLLRDNDLDIKLAAYEQLRKINDIAITQQLVANSFYMEQISYSDDKAIFVSRRGQPRIALFGSKIKCRDNIFIQSSNNNITINAPEGQKYVSLMRKHPTHKNVIIELKSTFTLSDIILKLCKEPVPKTDRAQPGLGVSYSDAIVILKQMCDKGAVDAEFRAGPLPKTH